MNFFQKLIVKLSMLAGIFLTFSLANANSITNIIDEPKTDESRGYKSKYYKPGEFFDSWHILNAVKAHSEFIEFPSEELDSARFQEEPMDAYKIQDSILNGSLEINNNRYYWRKSEFKSNTIDLIKFLSRQNHSYTYAATELNIEQGNTYLMAFGSDDGIKVWVNGNLVHSKWIGRSALKDDDVFPVNLRKGKNQILVKIYNRYGDWGFLGRVLNREAYQEAFVLAACNGNNNALKHLLKEGVDINAENQHQISAIECADMFDHYESIKLLKAHGAKFRMFKPAIENFIDMQFERYVEEGAPGYAVGVFGNGKTLVSKGYGLAKIENREAIHSKTKFYIASTSKQFTAASVLMLVRDGAVKLDDTLHTFFPEFPEYAKLIKVSHLIHHTSGLGDFYYLIHERAEKSLDEYSAKDLMEFLIKYEKTKFPPGSEHAYSNSGYWLLGQIVEKVTGKDLASFAKERIFKPLGMNNTAFSIDHHIHAKNRALGYTYDEFGNVQVGMKNLKLMGSGGLYTNIEDMKLWDDAFRTTSVFDKEFWKLMTTRGTLNNGKTIHYASGLEFHDYKGMETISHSGAFPGFRADMLRVPQHNYTFVVFSNRDDSYPLAHTRRLVDLYLKDKMKQSENSDRISDFF